jgi:hypothetical protein
LVELIDDMLKRKTFDNFINILKQNKYKSQQIVCSIQVIVKILLFLSNDKKVKNLCIYQGQDKDSINIITDNYYKFFKKHLSQIDHHLHEINE